VNGKTPIRRTTWKRPAGNAERTRSATCSSSLAPRRVGNMRARMHAIRDRVSRGEGADSWGRGNKMGSRALPSKTKSASVPTIRCESLRNFAASRSCSANPCVRVCVCACTTVRRLGSQFLRTHTRTTYCLSGEHSLLIAVWWDGIGIGVRHHEFDDLELALARHIGSCVMSA
jgi:hypothetical protein